ncbi:MAG: hypothetical protein AB8G26_17795 [Ilumatobacter sp.]
MRTATPNRTPNRIVTSVVAGTGRLAKAVAGHSGPGNSPTERALSSIEHQPLHPWR